MLSGSNFWNRFRYRIGKVCAVDEELKGANLHGVSTAAVKHREPWEASFCEGERRNERTSKISAGPSDSQGLKVTFVILSTKLPQLPSSSLEVCTKPNKYASVFLPRTFSVLTISRFTDSVRIQNYWVLYERTTR